jgi:carbonic anhydrase
MDARLDPLPVLGLEVGQAHVLRNAGGVITPDVLRSLALSQRALGTREIALVHHTDCGMAGFDDATFRAELADESGATPDWDVPGFADPHEDVRRSLDSVRGCPWLTSRDSVRGYVYDLARGALNEVS